MFWTLTVALGVFLVGATLYAYFRTGDVFHPLVLLAPMLGFLYCYLPWNAAADGGLYHFLPEQFLELAQTVHLAGAAALVIGILVGGRPIQVARSARPEQPTSIRRWALAAGLLGLGGFLYGIAFVGGFTEAYGSAYGGGWAESGYLRELPLLALPAATYLVAPAVNIGWRKRYLAVALVASPLVIHGLFGARRGPTFMAIVGITVAWYVARAKRPPTLAVVIGGAALGVALLLLVVNRGSIYLGSDLKLDKGPGELLEASQGNEFIYSAGLVVDAAIRDRYSWGRRYATVLFVRPIPRFFWPDKYEDAARFLGGPSIEQNLGLPFEEMRYTVGWEGPPGAAPGVVGDLWVEFWWLSLGMLLFLGYVHGRVWRRAVTSGGPWAVAYAIMAALSIYLVMQTLEAWLFRFLIMGCAALLIWRFGRTRLWPARWAPARHGSALARSVPGVTGLHSR